MINLDNETEAILLGSLIGDGRLSKGTINSNPKYVEYHCIEQEKYLIWKANKLKTINPKVFYLERYNKTKTGKYTCIGMASGNLVILNKYLNDFYPNQYITDNRINTEYKVISESLYGKYFSSMHKDDLLFCLAVFYCDDGCYCYYTNRVVFYIHNLDYSFIQKIFNDLNLEITMRKNRTIVLNKQNTDTFLRLIKAYVLSMPSCMHYKLGHLLETNREKLIQKKQLIKEKNKRYRKEKRDELKLKDRKYYLKNKCKILKRVESYYKLNKEKCIKYHKEHYQKNKKAISKKQKEYRFKERDRINQQFRHKYKTDPVFRRKMLESHKKYALKNKEKIAAYMKEYYKKNKSKFCKKNPIIS